MKQLKSKTLRTALALALAAGIAGIGEETEAATATANATAEVITPIAITKTVDLDFGRLAAGTGGTVVMSAAGSRTATGAVVLSTVDEGNAASFDVSGDANATYAITLPTTSIDITSGVNTMTVDTFTSSPSATGTLDATGAQTLTVGATLTVADAQATGSYTGTFDVSVEYN